MACLTGFFIVVNKLISLISSYSGHHYLSFCDNIPPSGQILFSNFFGQKLNFRGYVNWRFFSKVSLRWSCLHYQWLYIELSYMTACFVRIPLTMSYQCTDVMPHMLVPHCIVLRPRYCLDRVTSSRVNVLQLKDCKWNCQMNWAIAVVSRKLLIMISFDGTEKFSIVTKKRKHFEPQAFCYFTKNARTIVVDYGTILHRGRKIQAPVVQTMDGSVHRMNHCPADKH